MKITIGSRGSSLALWQANWVKDQLESAGREVTIQIIKTSGDKLQTAALAASGTKGLFIKEIEEALLAGEVDLAVHSMKDLPTDLPEGLGVAAVPEREDPHDALVSTGGLPLQDLPAGSRIGTSSLRRQSQLLALRPDLEVVPMRGNVDTRLRKLERGDCEALVLAGAGLKLLGVASHITSWFGEGEICPAVGQGALAVEISMKNAAVKDAVAPLDHPSTHQAVRAEILEDVELARRVKAGGGRLLFLPGARWVAGHCWPATWGTSTSTSSTTRPRSNCARRLIRSRPRGCVHSLWTSAATRGASCRRGLASPTCSSTPERSSSSATATVRSGRSPPGPADAPGR